MVIANQTSDAEHFTFEYRRRGPIGGRIVVDHETMTVQVDCGAGGRDRAREVARRQLDSYTERNRAWTYELLD